jgi:hypothetical protein
VLFEAFRALRRRWLELHLITKHRPPPAPCVCIHNNPKGNSEPLNALPTFGDCLPMVLSEAGASGMAIIRTNVVAIPEDVGNGKMGLMIPAGDAVSLTRALRDLATNLAYQMLLCECAVAHARRHHCARLMPAVSSTCSRQRQTQR